jgi:hypothetical protein
VRVRVRVDSVEITGQQTSTIYLPKNPTDLLRAHEYAHYQLADYSYDRSRNLAEAFAQRLLQQDFTARSEEQANADIKRFFQEQFRAEQSAFSDRVQKRFDALTDHGRNKSPSATEAMKRVMAEER